MPYLEGGNLRRLQLSLQDKRFTESQARFYLTQIASGLQYLHKKGIEHRNLKPENTLLDSRGYVKMTDFGLQKYVVEGGKNLSLDASNDNSVDFS